MADQSQDDMSIDYPGSVSHETSDTGKMMSNPVKFHQARKSAEGLSYAVAVMLPWVLNDVIGYPVPPEVMMAMGSVLTGAAVRLRDWL